MIMHGRHSEPAGDARGGTAPAGMARSGIVWDGTDATPTMELIRPVEGEPDEATTTDGTDGTDGVADPGDPFDDDLDARLRALAPRRPVTRVTVALAATALVTAGFLAGTLVQKHYGTPSTATAAGTGNRGAFPGGAFPSGFARQRQGGAAAPGQPQDGAATPGQTQSAAGGATTGRVKLVDGTTVYIETSDGQVITVKTSGSTSVRVASGGALSDLTPGASVTVEGTGSGSSVTATTITRNP